MFNKVKVFFCKIGGWIDSFVDKTWWIFAIIFAIFFVHMIAQFFVPTITTEIITVESKSMAYDIFGRKDTGYLYSSGILRTYRLDMKNHTFNNVELYDDLREARVFECEIYSYKYTYYKDIIWCLKKS